MKRLTAVVGLCSLFSIASFAVLVAADRQLGLPLPYSIPLSFTTISILAPAMFAVANAVRLRRPFVITVAPVTPVRATAAPSNPGRDAAVPRRPAEGVVLLDFSKPRAVAGRAA
jgi:hypothetical protein